MRYDLAPFAICIMCYDRKVWSVCRTPQHITSHPNMAPILDPVMIPWDKCRYTCLDTSACCFMFFKHVEWTLHSLSNNLWPNAVIIIWIILAAKVLISDAFGLTLDTSVHFMKDWKYLAKTLICIPWRIMKAIGDLSPLRTWVLFSGFQATMLCSWCHVQTLTTRRGRAAIAIDFTARKTLAWRAFAVHGHAFQTFARLSLSTTSQQHQDQPCGPTHHQTHSTMHVLSVRFHEGENFWWGSELSEIVLDKPCSPVLGTLHFFFGSAMTTGFEVPEITYLLNMYP